MRWACLHSLAYARPIKLYIDSIYLCYMITFSGTLHLKWNKLYLNISMVIRRNDLDFVLTWFLCQKDGINMLPCKLYSAIRLLTGPTEDNMIKFYRILTYFISLLKIWAFWKITMFKSDSISFFLKEKF